MRTVHLVLPPNLRIGGPFETHGTLAYAKFVYELSKSLGYNTNFYGIESEDQPDCFIALMDRAKSLRLNAAIEEWPPKSEVTRELADCYNSAALMAIKQRLADDNYIITFANNGLFFSQHVKNANIISAQTRPREGRAELNIYSSYACMHAVSVQNASQSSQEACGHYFDSILHYAPSQANGLVRAKDDYLLFDVRNADEKFVAILAESAGLRCVGVDRSVIAGREYFDLLSRARCLVSASLAMDFVGHGAIDALSFGTPVICADWGAAAEIVRHGLVGYRCRRLAEYIRAVHDLKDIDPITIRYHFEQRFSFQRAKAKFSEHLDQIADMWSDGFYSQRPPSAARYD